MSYRPGDTLYIGFTTLSTSGASVDADSTPVAMLRRNGAVDSAVTVTVTRNDVGDYTASAVLPLTYSGGDNVDLLATCIIATVTSKRVLRVGSLDRTAQAVAQVVYRTPQVHFVSMSGDPTYDGLSPDTANALPTDPSPGPGETILVFPGTYPIDTTIINLAGDGVTGVNLVGAGMGATTITSNALISTQGCIVHPGNGSQMCDLTIQGIAAIATTNKYQAPIGASAAQATFIGAVARRLNLIGDSDGFYLKQTAATIGLRAYDCIVQTKYDALFLSATSDSRVELHNCHTIVSGPSTCYGGAISRGLNVECGTLEVYGGSFNATNANTGTWGVRTGTTGIMIVHEADISSSASTGTDYDLDNSGTSLSVFDCDYVTSKTNGVITIQNAAATLAAAQSFNNTGQTAPIPATTAFGGPNSVTLVFHDASGNAVPGVVFTVRGIGTAVANGSGTITVSLSTGTFIVSALPTAGTLWTDTTIDVTGTATFTLTGTAQTIPSAPNVSQTTAYLTTRDGQGNVRPGVILSFQLVDPHAGTDSYDQTAFTAVSDSSALIQVALLKTTQYQARVGSGPWVAFTTGSGSTFALPEILGTYSS